jgi:hypothetical protein
MPLKTTSRYGSFPPRSSHRGERGARYSIVFKKPLAPQFEFYRRWVYPPKKVIGDITRKIKNVIKPCHTTSSHRWGSSLRASTMQFGQLGCKSPLVQKAIFESDARKQATSNLTTGNRFSVRHTSQTLAFDCWRMASGGKNRAQCKPRVTPAVSQNVHTCKPEPTRL